MRKVKGNELRSDGQLQVQCFSKKWHITENLEKGNLGKINEIVYYVMRSKNEVLCAAAGRLTNQPKHYFCSE
jgi:hypothetical protein